MPVGDSLSETQTPQRLDSHAIGTHPRIEIKILETPLLQNVYLF